MTMDGKAYWFNLMMPDLSENPNDSDNSERSIGDVVSYNGTMWMFDGEGFIDTKAPTSLIRPKGELLNDLIRDE